MKTIINFKLLLSLTSLMLLGSCATSTINQAEMAKVKKVAIVGFIEYRPASATLSYDIGSGKAGAEAGGSIIVEKSKETDQMLDSVNKGLASKKGWKMTDTVSMKKNPVYVEAWKYTMEGWQNKMPTNPGLKAFTVEGVMDADGVRILGKEKTNKLIADLSVDAIAVIELRTMLKATTFMGIGSRKPYMQVFIRLYSPNEANPIWFQTFQSDVSSESVGSTHFIDEKLLVSLAMDNLKNVLSKIQ
jgi:hypothetical protein